MTKAGTSKSKSCHFWAHNSKYRNGLWNACVWPRLAKITALGRFWDSSRITANRCCRSAPQLKMNLTSTRKVCSYWLLSEVVAASFRRCIPHRKVSVVSRWRRWAKRSRATCRLKPSSPGAKTWHQAWLRSKPRRIKRERNWYGFDQIKIFVFLYQKFKKIFIS